MGSYEVDSTAKPFASHLQLVYAAQSCTYSLSNQVPG